MAENRKRVKSPATDGLDEGDAVIIELGRQIFTSHRVDAALYARAHALFGTRALVELVMLMGNYAAIAAVLTTFDAQLPEGQPPLLPPRA